MGIFSFLASVGKKLASDDSGLKTADLKKELDSYGESFNKRMILSLRVTH